MNEEPSDTSIPEPSSATKEETPVAVTGTLVTREQAARIAGVSEATIRRREREEVITPILRADGTHVFEESEIRSSITTLRRRVSADRGTPDGGIAADIFELLDKKVHPADIVKQLRLAPSVVKQVAAEWGEMRGVFLVYPSEAAELGNVKCTADLVARAKAVEKLVEAVNKRTQEQGELAHRLEQKERDLARTPNLAAQKLALEQQKIQIEHERVMNERMRDQEEARLKRTAATFNTRLPPGQGP